MKRYFFSYLIIVLFLCSANVVRGQNTLSVSAPAVVEKDEVFNIIYTANGKVGDFTPPQFPGFNVLAGPSLSKINSTQIINGKRTHTYEMSYTYVLQAKEIGKFTISPASAEIEGKRYSSNSVSIEIIKSASNKGESSKESSTLSSKGVGSNDIQLRMILNKSRVVKGEPIIATLKLYTKVNINGFEDVKFPTFNGFWSQEIETPSNVEFIRETLNGEIYSAALLRKYMLIPQQSGNIQIDAAELICQVPVRSSVGSNSIFDDFFDSYETQKKRVSTPPITINVAQLPAGAPSSFTGGVGDFKIEAHLSKGDLKSHEAASLIVTITGSGNINLIEAPNIVFPPDFEVYDIKRSEELKSGSNGTSGSKTFEYPFIPRSHGNFDLKGVEFSYYDISKGKYVTIKSSPIVFDIAQGVDNGSVVMSGGVNKQSVKSLGEDIRFISLDKSKLNMGNNIFILTPIFYILILVAILLYVWLFFFLKKRIKRRSDVLGSKNRRAKKVAKARLKNAENLLKRNLYSAFYEELHKAVTGYISDKFMIPLSDMNRDRIREELSKSGKDESLIMSLFTLLDACEYARYAPTSGFEAMENHYKGAIDIISEIES